MTPEIEYFFVCEQIDPQYEYRYSLIIYLIQLVTLTVVCNITLALMAILTKRYTDRLGPKPITVVPIITLKHTH